ncbi:unnamed protein product [Heterobilharzia americana]|nr:unnamed protein product [Heterobilharzia americana]
MKKRNNIIILLNKLAKIARKYHFSCEVSVEDEKHLNEFKKIGLILLNDVMAVFEEAASQIRSEHQERKDLLLTVFERYNTILKHLLSVCSNLYVAVISGRNNLHLRNTENLRNKDNLQNVLRSLNKARSNNLRLRSVIEGLNSKILRAMFTTKSSEAAISNIHRLYQLQLQRTENDHRKLTLANHHCSQMALSIVQMFCNRNMVTILDQLQTSKDKWLFTYDRSFLLMRKLITQLYETLTASTEGIVRFSEHLEYLFMSSKYYLNELLKTIEKFETFLHSVFEDDVKNRNLEYATRASVHLTDIQDTAQKVLNKIGGLWTVKKHDLINHIALNSGQYEVSNPETEDNINHNNDNGDICYTDKKVKNPAKCKQKGSETVNTKRYKPSAFSSTLRLECSSQNAAQPKFYKQLFNNTNYELTLYDLKLLLKSASDEFHELFVFLKENLNSQQPSGLFNWFNLTKDINGLESVYNRLSSILTIQERNLIKLINLYDLGISTFIHMIEKLKNNLNNEQDAGPFYDLKPLKEKFDEWKDLLTLDASHPTQYDPSVNKTSADDKEVNYTNDKSAQTLLTESYYNQSTLDLIINVQQTLNQRLSELNLNLVNNVNRIEKKRSIICQKITSKWISSAVIWICLNDYTKNSHNNNNNNTVKDQLFERISNHNLNKLFMKINFVEGNDIETYPIPGNNNNRKTENSITEINENHTVGTISANHNGSIIADANINENNNDDKHDYEWITLCFKKYYQNLQNQLSDFQTKYNLNEAIHQIINELDDISSNLNINTSLSKYFKEKEDCEVWEQEKNYLELTKTEFIQAWYNLSNELFYNHSECAESVKTDSAKEHAQREDAYCNTSFNLDQLRERDHSELFCIDSLDYLNRLYEAASERKKTVVIRRKNIEESMKSKQELINKLEKEMEDVDQKLIELRTKLGETFESIQSEFELEK